MSFLLHSTFWMHPVSLSGLEDRDYGFYLCPLLSSTQNETNNNHSYYLLCAKHWIKYITIFPIFLPVSLKNVILMRIDKIKTLRPREMRTPTSAHTLSDRCRTPTHTRPAPKPMFRGAGSKQRATALSSHHAVTWR